MTCAKQTNKKKVYTDFMAEESQGIVEDSPKPKGHYHTQVVGKDMLGILDRVSPQFGVSIAILQTEGKQYMTYRGVRGTLEEGETYVAFSSAKNDLTDFWNAVDAEKARAAAETPKP